MPHIHCWVQWQILAIQEDEHLKQMKHEFSEFEASLGHMVSSALPGYRDRDPVSKTK